MQVQHGKSSKLLLGILFAVVALGCVLYTLYRVGRNDGYSPDQPIPFSHKKHAGTYNIPCMYCHTSVEKSKHATVPPMNVCMNCHSVVKPDSPHIQKLKQLYLEKKEPFQWIKVHDLPDHVNFSHKRHIAKGVACETCHGDVKSMEKIKQAKPMTMGWCLDCHRGKTTPDYVYDNLKTPKGSQVAPTSCYTCHQ
ncbi:MAG: cytochrome c3 family protein [Bacteriovoracia bacterium]